MKKLFVTIQFLLLISASAFAQVMPFSPVENRDTTILTARNNAINMIEEFISELDPSRNPVMLVTMVNGLKDTSLVKRNSAPASPVPNNACDKFEGSISAYVPSIPFQNQIRICPLGMSFNLNQLAQIFIHESYHLAQGILGYAVDKVGREVGAVKVESDIMKKLVGCSYVYQGYFDQPEYAARLKDSQAERLPECN